MISKSEVQQCSTTDTGTSASASASIGANVGAGYGPWVRSVARTVVALRHRRRALAARSSPSSTALPSAPEVETPASPQESALRGLMAKPMNFLRRIEKASFPVTIHDDTDIRNAKALAAASLVEANLPERGAGEGRSGVIMWITPSGWAELERPEKDRKG